MSLPGKGKRTIKKTKKRPHQPKPSQKSIDAASKARIGNNWWNLRTKHGREKLFADPEAMWEAACEYFKYVDGKQECEVRPMVVKGKLKMVEIVKKQPYSLQGLCLYLNCSATYFKMFKTQIKESDPNFEGFINIIANIEHAIFTQQYDGAASGFFNNNIIARSLGLAEKIDAEVVDNRKAVGDLFPTQLNGTKE